jgi:hypothetical protein
VGLSRPVFPSGFRARPRLATFDRQANLNHGLREINMAYDKTISPVDWYFGSYLLRFVEIDEPGQNDPDRRFVAWENTVLVKAKSMDSAYTKVERIGKAAAKPYRGGPKGVRVKWEYVGITQLVPVYEPIADGAEIAWADHGSRKLKTLKRWVRPKQDFHR